MTTAMTPASSIASTAATRSRTGASARRRRNGRSGAAGAVERRTVGRILRLLRREAPRWNAPVMALEAAQHGDPFRVLIGCILSLRTRDETTAEAAPRLFAAAAGPQAMLALGEDAIARLIYPVGFYRTKAAVIVGICRELITRFGSRVPDSIDALLMLKGVGRKTANLVVTQAYGKPGICVDTHVHRISNRWGLVTTRTPDKTEAALRAALPRRYWIEYNTLLVAFGQTICQPLSPWCSRCPAARMCPRRGVTRAR
ncbi:MAG TPA: endonuclease III [Candidatus Binataceae bacterium]|nr:endonuclease III [Candidatus Binataceae bacterium]